MWESRDGQVPRSLIHPVTGLPIRPPIRGFIGGEDFVQAHSETIIPKLRDLVPFEPLGFKVEKAHGVPNKLVFPNGSQFKFLSYEQDRTKWESSTFNVGFFDEPPPRFAWVGAQRGLMKKEGPAYFAMTPLKEPWIFEELWNHPRAIHPETELEARGAGPDDCLVINISLDEVRHLSEEAKRRFIEKLDPEEMEARRYGRFKHLMGRAFPSFSEDEHVLPVDWFEERYAEVA